MVEKKLYKAINVEHINSKENSNNTLVNDSQHSSDHSRSRSTVSYDFLENLEKLTKKVFSDNRLPKTKATMNLVRQSALRKISRQLNTKPSDNNQSIASDTSMAFRKESFQTQLRSVISNRAFVSLCLSLTGLYFVVTGIQFWLSDYLENVLGVERHQVSVYFAISSFTAPVSGVFVGGLVTTAFGGYTTERA